VRSVLAVRARPSSALLPGLPRYFQHPSSDAVPSCPLAAARHRLPPPPCPARRRRRARLLNPPGRFLGAYVHAVCRRYEPCGSQCVCPWRSLAPRRPGWRRSLHVTRDFRRSFSKVRHFMGNLCLPHSEIAKQDIVASEQAAPQKLPFSREQPSEEVGFSRGGRSARSLPRGALRANATSTPRSPFLFPDQTQAMATKKKVSRSADRGRPAPRVGLAHTPRRSGAARSRATHATATPPAR
jgi:hypothetical protein